MLENHKSGIKICAKCYYVNVKIKGRFSPRAQTQNVGAKSPAKVGKHLMDSFGWRKYPIKTCMDEIFKKIKCKENWCARFG